MPRDESPGVKHRYNELVEWLAEYPERIALAAVGWILAASMIAAMGFRLAWRRGWAEPQTRESYAVVTAFAELGSLIMILALLTIGAAVYHHWRGDDGRAT